MCCVCCHCQNKVYISQQTSRLESEELFQEKRSIFIFIYYLYYLWILVSKRINTESKTSWYCLWKPLWPMRTSPLSPTAVARDTVNMWALELLSEWWCKSPKSWYFVLPKALTSGLPCVLPYEIRCQKKQNSSSTQQWKLYCPKFISFDSILALGWRTDRQIKSQQLDKNIWYMIPARTGTCKCSLKFSFLNVIRW